MAFQTKAVLPALVTILQNTAGIQWAQRGAPKSLKAKVSGFACIAPQDVSDKAGGLLQRRAQYFVGFLVRVDGDEEAAEDALGDVIDAFLIAFYADRTLGGVSPDGAVLTMPAADIPQYQIVDGQEARAYHALVTCRQYQTYNTSP